MACMHHQGASNDSFLCSFLDVLKSHDENYVLYVLIAPIIQPHDAVAMDHATPATCTFQVNTVALMHLEP